MNLLSLLVNIRVFTGKKPWIKKVVKAVNDTLDRNDTVRPVHCPSGTNSRNNTIIRLLIDRIPAAYFRRAIINRVGFCVGGTEYASIGDPAVCGVHLLIV